MLAIQRNTILHVFGCIIFLSLPVFFSPDFGDLSRMVHVNFFRRDFCLSFLLLAFFYLNYYYLTPRFYITKKYVLFFVCVIGCYALIVLIPESFMWTDLQPMEGRPDFDHHDEPHLLPFSVNHSFLQFVIILIFSLLLRIREQLKRMESEKVNSELAYLKAQINPHFLFNTLNSIYSLVILRNDRAADAIVKLSDMMRYVLGDGNTKFVSLEKELSYISNYVELQTMRLSNHIKLTYDCEGDFQGKKIAPLVLIPFIENAFKHGVNSEEDSEIVITIVVSHVDLILTVKNRCMISGTTTLKKSGLGIENTRQRLNFLYPENHVLNITQANGYFTVSLLLPVYD